MSHQIIEHGIIGLRGGHESNLGNLFETYEDVKRGAAYLGIDWTEGLLPFCEWGCNIFTCVDCNDSECRVFRSEERRATEQGYQNDIGPVRGHCYFRESWTARRAVNARPDPWSGGVGERHYPTDSKSRRGRGGIGAAKPPWAFLKTAVGEMVAA
jgi:hypothetical protein